MEDSAAVCYRIIAIDGPAASGKSSVARALAQRIGFAYVNSGAMYRAVTWHVLRRGVRAEDAAAITQLVEHSRIVCRLEQRELEIEIDGADPCEHLRDDHVNEGVSLVSSVPRVREILVEQMRRFGTEADLVVEGRDIGSVVFPDTPFKFYIDASPEVRLQRRTAQGQRDEIVARDRADSSRSTSPLVVARDAQVIDSSHLSVDAVVNQIVKRLEANGFK